MLVSVSVFARDRRVMYVSSNAKATLSKMAELVIVLRMTNSAHLPEAAEKLLVDIKTVRNMLCNSSACQSKRSLNRNTGGGIILQPCTIVLQKEVAFQKCCFDA